MVGLSQKQSIRVRDTLVELRRWLITDDERDSKNQQKLLRNLRVNQFFTLCPVFFFPT